MKYPCRRKAAGTSSDESIFAIKRSSLPVTDSMSVLVNTTKSEEISTRSCTSFSQAASNGMTIGITSSLSGNHAYIDSLAQIRRSMQDIAQGGRTPDPAVHQAASQNYDKAM